jgi:hypothetical protein
MMKRLFVRIGMVIVLAPAGAFAVDGITLINQSTVMAAGGFPYSISVPGSYKLSGNLTVPAGQDGIDIHSANVALDLNGFAIIGSGNSGAGFGVASPNQYITLRNGSVTNFPIGLLLTGTGEIADLNVSANGTGIVVIECQGLGNSFAAAAVAACNRGGFESSQTGFVIVRTSANLNQNDGFELWNSSVSDSMANGNLRVGFLVVASTLIHNIANNNLVGATAKEQPSESLFGSNTFLNNTLVSLGGRSDRVGGVSQGNNLCTAGSC